VCSTAEQSAGASAAANPVWNFSGLRRFWRGLMRRLARKVPYKTPPFWKGQLVALLCTAAGLAVRLPLTPLVRDKIPVVLFYPCVLVASVWGGTLAGLTVTVLGAAIGDLLWLPPDGAIFTLVAFTIACLSVILMAGLFRSMVEVHAEEEARAILVTHEMKHRANNVLGVVQAISAQTARNARTVAEHQALFGARLMALARAQQLASENPGVPPQLRAFVLQVLEPFGLARFTLEGAEVCVPDHHGASIALLLHELSTNATKYGALSVPEGKVAISWQQDAARVYLNWRELDGPAVTPPDRTGFGSRLFKTAFPPQLGESAITFHPDGVECRVSFTLT
jgi:two-component sensor histidine kinase